MHWQTKYSQYTHSGNLPIIQINEFYKKTQEYFFRFFSQSDQTCTRLGVSVTVVRCEFSMVATNNKKPAQVPTPRQHQTAKLFSRKNVDRGHYLYFSSNQNI